MGKDCKCKFQHVFPNVSNLVFTNFKDFLQSFLSLYFNVPIAKHYEDNHALYTKNVLFYQVMFTHGSNKKIPKGQIYRPNTQCLVTMSNVVLSGLKCSPQRKDNPSSTKRPIKSFMVI